MRTKKRISLGSFLKKNNKCLLFIKTRVINNNLSEYTRATAGCEDLLKTYLKNAGYFAGVQLCNINNIVRLLKETYFTYFTALPKYAFFLFISPPFPLYFICFTGRLYRYKWLFPNIVKVGSMIWCDAKKGPEVVSFSSKRIPISTPHQHMSWFQGLHLLPRSLHHSNTLLSPRGFLKSTQQVLSLFSWFTLMCWIDHRNRDRENLHLALIYVSATIICIISVFVEQEKSHCCKVQWRPW